MNSGTTANTWWSDWIRNDLQPNYVSIGQIIASFIQLHAVKKNRSNRFGFFLFLRIDQNFFAVDQTNASYSNYQG